MELAMVRSDVFKSNKSQAVRLPKAVAFPESVKRVDIVKLGAARLISPVDAAWDSFFDGPQVSEDFMTERAQPSGRAGSEP
jgi:antitoxin VapB|tara:strand:- start:551 stop:793 length:243 start_codon:yes stop_codon:yes gene_type:complete